MWYCYFKQDYNNHNRRKEKNMKPSIIIRKFAFAFVFLISLFLCSAWAQSPDIIDSISPNTADPGDSDVEVTINVDGN